MTINNQIGRDVRNALLDIDAIKAIADEAKVNSDIAKTAVENVDVAVDNANNAATDASNAVQMVNDKMVELEQVDSVQFHNRQNAFDAQLAETEQEVNTKADKVETITPISIVPEITTDFIVTGTPWNQVSKKQSASLTTNVIPSLEIPDMKLKNFRILGTDFTTGKIVGRIGTQYYEISDGGEKLEAITTNISFGNFWIDGKGNRYAAVGSEVHRAPKGTWNFSLAFTFPVGYPARFSFAHNDDNELIFVSYAIPDGSDGRGTTVATSVDSGLTWQLKNIDYGQVHLHASYIHKPTGVWYIVVGEGTANQWRGILKSSDKGQTWTQIQVGDGSYSQGVQPIYAVEIDDDHILWATDTTPSGFLLHNVTNDNIVRIPIIVNGVEYSGFAYSMRVDPVNNTIVVPFDSSAADGITNFIIMDRTVEGVKNPAAVVVSPYDKIKAKKWIEGTDAQGYFYAEAGEDDNKSWVWKSTKLVKRRVIQTATPNTFVGNGTFNNTPAKTTEMYEGMPVIKLDRTHGNTVVGDNYINVVAGDKIYITALVKRGNHTNTDNLQFQQNWRSNNTFVSFANTTIYLKNLPNDGNFHKFHFTLTVPTGVNQLEMKWVVGDDPHYLVGNVTVSKGETNDPLWMPNGAFTQKSEINLPLHSSAFIRNRIYQLGRASEWAVNTDFELMVVGGLKIGLSKPTGASAQQCNLYIQEEGGTRHTILLHQHGGSVDVKNRAFYKNGTWLHSSTFIPAPIIVGISLKQVLVVNPNTSDIHTINLGKFINADIGVELKGNAHHIFDYFPSVDGKQRSVLLKKA
ncbi:WD40/YVTN/BNR-like repeat-containing protein [Sutcliffiella horikoshii]|uniref:WD40/YVTN/BNR-like repeat-containing protein n=1 Tax=Sutcliffiella horikoshii TaxID=79883 RepID=UPI003CFA1544